MIAQSKGWYVSVLTAAAAMVVTPPILSVSAFSLIPTTASPSPPTQHSVISSGVFPGHNNMLPPSITKATTTMTLYHARPCSPEADPDDSTSNNNNNNSNNNNEPLQQQVVRYPFHDEIHTVTAATGEGEAALPFVCNDTVVIPSITATTTTTSLTNVKPTTTTISSSSSIPRQDNEDKEEEIQKKIRVAKAQAEIDRILRSHSAPFDVEAEMKKVISIHHHDSRGSSDSATGSDDHLSSSQRPKSPPNTQQNTESHDTPNTNDSNNLSRNDSSIGSSMELLVDRHDEMTSYDVEAQLYEAIRNQDYHTAAVQQKALQQLHYDATIEVLQCNAAFYTAFSKKDYKSMELLWLPNDQHVLCIHPSHVPIVSSHNINQSWKQMFTAERQSNFQKTWIEPTNIRINVRGQHLAIVTCEEQVYIRRFVRGQKRQTELINTLTATNIFYKYQSRWYMIHHHASWHPRSDAAQAALARSSSTATGASSPYIASLQKRQAAYQAQQEQSSDNNNNSNSKTNANPNSHGWDGILGMSGVGPVLGDIKPKKLLSPAAAQNNGSLPPQRRIVMGSLADILNGNLDDLLNGSKKNDKLKGNDNDENEEGSAIIQFHRIESEDDDDDDDDDIDLGLDDDDDDDDDEEDDTDDDDDDDVVISKQASRINGKNEAVSMIQEWASRRANDDETNKAITSEKLSKVDIAMKRQQQCLTLIRQLCAEGLISQQHKRTLLTDMIASSSSSSSASSGGTTNRKSQIQHAYEFLFASSDDDTTTTTTNMDADDAMYDIARDEFADQCRLIAESIAASASHPNTQSHS